MQPPVCCGCCTKISNYNLKKTFEDDLLVDSYESGDNKEPAVTKKRMKLYHGIELVIGNKVPKIDKLPGIICEICLTKLENFLNFRMQLLKSINILYDSTMNNENTDQVASSSYVPKDRVFHNNEEYAFQKNCNSPKILEQRVTPDDVINVDENSMPLNFNTALNEEFQTNNFGEGNKLQNDQDNNNMNESDNSNCSDEPDSKVMVLKVEKNDIESDIDVCSGEDDEVLELDIQDNRDEPVEISSSSESDIEVCDYEPSGKKLKDYSALSPLLHF